MTITKLNNEIANYISKINEFSKKSGNAPIIKLNKEFVILNEMIIDKHICSNNR